VASTISFVPSHSEQPPVVAEIALRIEPHRATACKATLSARSIGRAATSALDAACTLRARQQRVAALGRRGLALHKFEFE
jgi:hypothetical protein